MTNLLCNLTAENEGALRFCNASMHVGNLSEVKFLYTRLTVSFLLIQYCIRFHSYLFALQNLSYVFASHGAPGEALQYTVPS